jgi:hypothetical protein
MKKIEPNWNGMTSISAHRSYRGHSAGCQINNTIYESFGNEARPETGSADLGRCAIGDVFPGRQRRPSAVVLEVRPQDGTVYRHVG